MSKTNEQIEHAVRRALSDDPRLPFADEIKVESHCDADHYEVQVEDGYAGEAQRLLSTMPAS